MGIRWDRHKWKGMLKSSGERSGMGLKRLKWWLSLMVFYGQVPLGVLCTGIHDEHNINHTPLFSLPYVQPRPPKLWNFNHLYLKHLWILDWKASMIYFTVKLKIGWQRMTQPIEIHVEYCLTQSCKRGMLLKSHMINLYKNCILWLRKYTSYEPEIFCAYGFHGRMKHTIRLCEYFLKFLRYGLVKSQEFIGRYYY